MQRSHRDHQISIHALREEGDSSSLPPLRSPHHFYPRPPRGGRLVAPTSVCAVWPFLSTPSARRATIKIWVVVSTPKLFLSTPSARRATRLLCRHRHRHQFLSTPSARRATHENGGHLRSHPISIHALREEGDTLQPDGGRLSAISIHALREEGDRKIFDIPTATMQFLSTPSARRATTLKKIIIYFFVGFLSTPSARRATHLPRSWHLAAANFYPRPPRGGRQIRRTGHDRRQQISIHALREEGDHAACKSGSCRTISIHALREEGDSKNGEKHLRFCFIIKRSAQIWKSLSKNIRKNSCDLHRTA